MRDGKLGMMPGMFKHSAFYSVLGFLSLSPACVTWKPVDIANSDPNLARQQTMDKRVETGNAQAFIVDHPELDENTKKELRDGTISTHEALERLKKTPAQK
jgi:hypothetical protein